MGYKKGIYRGSKNSNSRLDETAVRAIKRRLYAGEPASGLARDYFVSAETIRRIGREETWGWLIVDEEPENIPDTTQPTDAEIQASLERFMVKKQNG